MDRFSRYGSAVRVASAVGAIAHQETGAYIDPQTLVDIVETAQQVMVLRDRYPAMIGCGDFLGRLADVSRAHFQAFRHGRGDVVGLSCVHDALPHAPHLFDKRLDTWTGEIGRVGRVESALVVMASGIGAGKRNGDEERRECRSSERGPGSEKRITRLLL